MYRSFHHSFVFNSFISSITEYHNEDQLIPNPARYTSSSMSGYMMKMNDIVQTLLFCF